MRSQYRQWTDPMTDEWDVPGGRAFVVYPLFAGERVLHDDGSWAPREFTYVEIPADPKAPYFVMECEYVQPDLVPRIIAFQVIQSDPKREVRTSDLRAVKLEDALEAAWLQVVHRPSTVQPDADAGEAVKQAASAAAEATNPRATFRGLRARNRRRISDEVHQEVAEIYQEAQPQGAPTKAVADHFGVAASTASLYVRRARDAGHLEPPKERRGAPAPSTPPPPTEGITHGQHR